MKKLFFYLLAFSTVAQADVKSLWVKNFNLDYTNPHGRGSAEEFGLENSKQNQADLNVVVERFDRDFKVEVFGKKEEQYEFKNAPDFLVESDAIKLQNLNLSFADKLNLSLGLGIFENRKDVLRLEGMIFESLRDKGESNPIDQLLQGATQRLSLKISKFYSNEKDFLEGVLDLPKIGGGLSISSLAFNIANKKFDLSADVRAQVSGKVKASGQMSYDSQKGLLTIKISEVKFGFLNITSKVFDELRKNESDRLKVKEPYLYYQLK